jgi:hypothetical protein
MIITNNTKATTFHYFIELPGNTACGDLGPEGEAVLPSFDNKTNVKVLLTIWQTTDEMELVLSDSGL